MKPLDLMRWLVRLVTPPGGTILEPFAGSGTTCEAAVIEGFRCIAIEREAAYLPLIVARLSKPIQTDLFGTPEPEVAKVKHGPRYDRSPDALPLEDTQPELFGGAA